MPFTLSGQEQEHLYEAGLDALRIYPSPVLCCISSVMMLLLGAFIVTLSLLTVPGRKIFAVLSLPL